MPQKTTCRPGFSTSGRIGRLTRRASLRCDELGVDERGKIGLRLDQTDLQEQIRGLGVEGLPVAGEELPVPLGVRPTQIGRRLAELLAGAITDLNVMSRRDRMRHIVQRITLSDAIELDPQAAMTIVLPLDGNMAVTGAETGEIGPLDALLLERGSEKPRLAPVGRCTLFLIRIDRIAARR